MDNEKIDKVKLDNFAPQNIKDIDSLKKLIEVYSNIPDDFQNNPMSILDVDNLVEKMAKNPENADTYRNIKEEIFKIYLNEIYEHFNSTKVSSSVIENHKRILKALNIDAKDVNLHFDFSETTLKSDYISASNSFKSRKGTISSFYFVNRLIDSALNDKFVGDKSFEIKENHPYSYTIKGSLHKEIFKETILSLCHPVGFDWEYLKVLYLGLNDHFGYDEIKKFKYLNIFCKSTNKKLKIVPNNSFLGEVKSISITESPNWEEDTEEIQVDFKNELGDTYRLIKGYNNHILIYDRRNPIIEDIELVNDSHGTLANIRKDGVISKIRFLGKSIWNLTHLELKITIKNSIPKNTINKEENKTYLRIPLGSVYSKKNSIILNIGEITKNLLKSDYNGSIIKDGDLGVNCTLGYDIEYSYKNNIFDEVKAEIVPGENDLWARLDDRKNSFIIGNKLINVGRDILIGEYSKRQMGYNEYLSPDAIASSTFKTLDYKGDLVKLDLALPIPKNGENTNRIEHKFAPSTYKDIEDLRKNHKNISNNSYLKQNTYNTDYSAKEYASQDILWTMFKKQTVIDPIYSPKKGEFSINGVSIKDSLGYFRVGENYKFGYSNSFILGGFKENLTYHEAMISNLNPNKHVLTVESLSDAEPINLLLETKDLLISSINPKIISNYPKVTSDNYFKDIKLLIDDYSKKYKDINRAIHYFYDKEVNYAIPTRIKCIYTGESINLKERYIGGMVKSKKVKAEIYKLDYSDSEVSKYVTKSNIKSDFKVTKEDNICIESSKISDEIDLKKIISKTAIKTDLKFNLSTMILKEFVKEDIMNVGKGINTKYVGGKYRFTKYYGELYKLYYNNSEHEHIEANYSVIEDFDIIDKIYQNYMYSEISYVNFIAETNSIEKCNNESTYKDLFDINDKEDFEINHKLKDYVSSCKDFENSSLKINTSDQYIIDEKVSNEIVLLSEVEKYNRFFWDSDGEKQSMEIFYRGEHFGEASDDLDFQIYRNGVLVG